MEDGKADVSLSPIHGQNDSLWSPISNQTDLESGESFEPMTMEELMANLESTIINDVLPHEEQQFLGGMTLEDFLVRSGVVQEAHHAPPPPPSAATTSPTSPLQKLKLETPFSGPFHGGFASYQMMKNDLESGESLEFMTMKEFLANFKPTIDDGDVIPHGSLKFMTAVEYFASLEPTIDDDVLQMMLEEVELETPLLGPFYDDFDSYQMMSKVSMGEEWSHDHHVVKVESDDHGDEQKKGKVIDGRLPEVLVEMRPAKLFEVIKTVKTLFTIVLTVLLLCFFILFVTTGQL